MKKFLVLLLMSLSVNVYSQIPLPQDKFYVEYWNNDSFSGSPTFARYESVESIRKIWGNDGPLNNGDFFSIRWQGIFTFATGERQISLFSDIDYPFVMEVYDFNNLLHRQTSREGRRSFSFPNNPVRLVFSYREQYGFASHGIEMFDSNFQFWPESPNIECTVPSNIPVKTPYFVGHSLVNSNMPWAFKKLVDDRYDVENTDVGWKHINGSNLFYNWTNPNIGFLRPNVSQIDAAQSGVFDTLILTEAGDVQDHFVWSNSVEYVREYKQLFNNVDTYIYQTWPSLNECDWEAEMMSDLPFFESIANNNDSKVIPVGLALNRLKKRIELSSIPGIPTFESLFVDDIHLGNTGNYFVALVMYSKIYNSCPTGLTSQFTHIYGEPFVDIPTDTARILQSIAWEEVTRYQQSDANFVLTQ